MRATKAPVNDLDRDSLEVFAAHRGGEGAWRPPEGSGRGLLGKWLPFLPNEFTIHECVTLGCYQPPTGLPLVLLRF